jgi:type II secretion system protein C
MRSSLLLSLAAVGLAAARTPAGAFPQLEPAPPAAGSPATASPTAAPAIEAVGVVRSNAPGRSVAILRALGRTRVTTIGETAFGARLVAIGTDGVTLERDGRQLELRLVQASSAPATAPRAPAPGPPAAGLPPEDPATPAREMDRRQVQVRLGEEMSHILADTAIAPVMEEGRVVGVQLTRVPEGSLLTDAGLRTGDVVTRINDTEIDGMATLIGLWPRLQNATELRAVVLRGGQPVSLRLTLR